MLFSLVCCLLLCTLSWRHSAVSAHHLDKIRTNENAISTGACDNYLEYIKEGDGSFAKLTLYNQTSMSPTSIRIEGLWYGPVQWKTYGRISLYEDLDTSINNIKNNKPVSYRIEFPNPKVRPRFVRIAMNDENICTIDDDTYPRSVFALTYTWHPTVKATTSLDKKTQNQIIELSNLDSHESALFYTFPMGFTSNEAIAMTSIDLESECGFMVGRDTYKVVPFIHNGTPLTPTEFPWLAAIYSKTPAGLQFLCGGTLVSTRTIVSAAHCFEHFKAPDVVVFLGRYNLQDYSEDSLLVRELERLLIHPEYNPTLFSDADVAILHLKKEVPFSDLVRPICLWKEPEFASDEFVEKGFVAGWGADEKGNDITTVPKVAEINIVTAVECLLSVDSRRLISPRTICGGNKNDSGPCMGDSGGGLMIFEKDHWILRGIVSAGHTKRGHCDLKKYVIYCDVVKHMSWVRQNLIT